MLTSFPSEVARSAAAGQAAQVGPSSKVEIFESGRELYRQYFPPDAPNPAQPVRSMSENLLTPRHPKQPRPGPNTPEELAARQIRVSGVHNAAASPLSLAEHALARKAVRSGRIVESDA